MGSTCAPFTATISCEMTHEYAAGHNYTAWRDNLARGIEAIFPSR